MASYAPPKLDSKDKAEKKLLCLLEAMDWALAKAPNSSRKTTLGGSWHIPEPLYWAASMPPATPTTPTSTTASSRTPSRKGLLIFDHRHRRDKDESEDEDGKRKNYVPSEAL